MLLTERFVERANDIHRVIGRGWVSSQELPRIGSRGCIIARRLYDLSGSAVLFCVTRRIRPSQKDDGRCI